MTDKQGKKIFIFVLIDLVIICVLLVYFGIIRPHYHQVINISGTFIEKPRQIQPFQLTDNHGNAFTQEQLKGHWTLLFFGFTQCAMVCPTTMSALDSMYKKLEKELPQSKMPQVVFVTVDPQHDSIRELNKYLNSFNRHFIGARAEMTETLALENQLAVATAKINNTINHSAEILVINPDGRVQAYLSYPHEADVMVKDYELLLRERQGVENE